MLAWLQGEWDHLYKYYETVVHSSLFNRQKYLIKTMKINVSIWKPWQIGEIMSNNEDE